MSERRLWLEEPCPTCGAPSGLRCQTSRYRGKPMRVLHAARGWRHRSCPACKAEPGELCRTPTGRRAAQPHTARLHPGRRELFAEQGVWEELERWGAFTALVRFSGGGGSQGAIAAVTLEDAKKRELARWSGGEGELPEALAAAGLGPLRAVPRPPTDHWTGDLERTGAAGRGRRRAGRPEVRRRAHTQAAHPRNRRACAPRHVASIRRPGGARHVAGRRRRGERGLVRVVWRADAGRSAPRGAVLQEGLSTGCIARALEGPPSLPATQSGRGVRVVRRADAGRPASRGAVLQKAVSAGVLATRPQSCAAALRRPRRRATRRILEMPRR